MPLHSHPEIFKMEAPCKETHSCACLNAHAYLEKHCDLYHLNNNGSKIHEKTLFFRRRKTYSGLFNIKMGFVRILANS